MTTVQIIGVSVAAAAVLLLIVALVVTRSRGDDAQDEMHGGDSFLDQAPQDTLSGLGKPEQPVEDITLDPALERFAAERSAAAAAAREPQPGGLGLDWGPDLSVRTLEHEQVAAPAWDGDAETTGELRPDSAETRVDLRPDQDTPPAPEGQSGGQTAVPEPARPAEGGPTAGGPAVKESGSDSRLVPLSDIIVTTSGKLVDLDDPEVRRMLTELVTYEIDQAADFRGRGQSIDAVLQLTEAEKVARALGMTESARRIRAMMEEIRREE